MNFGFLCAFLSEFCRPELLQRGDPMKQNFKYFQKQKWILPTIRAWKVDEKNGVVYLFLMCRSWVMVLKMLKMGHFFQFLCWSEWNSGMFREIWRSVSERSRCALSENGMVCRVLSNGLGDIRKRIFKKVLTRQKIDIFFKVLTTSGDNFS